MNKNSTDNKNNEAISAAIDLLSRYATLGL